MHPWESLIAHPHPLTPTPPLPPGPLFRRGLLGPSVFSVCFLAKPSLDRDPKRNALEGLLKSFGPTENFHLLEYVLFSPVVVKRIYHYGTFFFQELKQVEETHCKNIAIPLHSTDSMLLSESPARIFIGTFASSTNEGHPKISIRHTSYRAASKGVTLSHSSQAVL